MSNDLVPNNSSTDLDVFDTVIGSDSDYLPRLQLFSNKTAAVGDGRIPMNHYGLVQNDDIIDLGIEINVAVLAARHKAMSTDGDIESSYDPNSDLFKDFVIKAGIKDSGCMYGPEFLLYIPSSDMFATYFMASATARRESKKFKVLMNKPAKLSSKPAEKGKYRWQAPVILPSDETIDLDVTKAQVQIDKFRNPPEDSAELASEDERDR